MNLSFLVGLITKQEWLKGLAVDNCTRLLNLASKRRRQIIDIRKHVHDAGT